VAPSDSEIYFLAKKLVLFANSKGYRKNFSSIAHIEESSKNYFAENDSKQAASVEFEMHSIAIIAGTRHGFDNLTSLRD